MKVNGRYIPGGALSGPTVAINMGQQQDIPFGITGVRLQAKEVVRPLELFMPAPWFLATHNPKTDKPLVSAAEIEQLGIESAVELGFKRLNEQEGD